MSDVLPLPMAGPAVERSDAAANRERILCEARRVLREEGLAAASIDRIAAEAGVGKGTIFRRFGDRAGLTSALLDEHMRTFQDAFLSGPPPLGPGAPPAARLEAFADGVLALFDDDLEVALAAEGAASGNGRRATGALAIHVRALVDAIDPTVDAGAVADMILGALSAPVIARLRADGVGLAEQQAAARVLLRGLTGAAALSA